MLVSFMLVDGDGNLVLESANKAKVYLSKDGEPFSLTDLTATEIGSGMYSVNIPEDNLRCINNVLILIKADGCQNTVYEYNPISNAEEVADAVWKAKERTLTSLNVSSQKANQTLTSRKSDPTPPAKRQGLSVKQILGGK